MLLKNTGFIPDIVTDNQWFFGSLPQKGIQLDGQWDEFLPVDEYQRKSIETYNCTSFGTLNAIETLYRALYKKEINWSDRFLGIMAGTTRRGNSPHKIGETVRKTGLVEESVLPFTPEIKNWQQYYSPNPMTQKYLDIAQEWLKDYEFGHEWIHINHNYLMDALKYSPLGISVCAWKYRNGLYYKEPNDSDNHWCMLYGYQKGRYWKIFDSYDDTTKSLEWDYNFLFSKRYYLQRTKLMGKLYRKKGKQEVVAKVGNNFYWFRDVSDFDNLATEIPWINWDATELVNDFSEEMKKQNIRIIGEPDLRTSVNSQIFGTAPEMKK